MTETPRTGRSAKMIAAAVVVGLMGSGALVWQASSAAFTASTQNQNNSWASGQVALTDNVPGGAWFNETSLVPDQTGKKCVEVTYNGNVKAGVKLFGSVGATAVQTMSPYLELHIERGTTTCADINNIGTVTNIFGDGDGVLSGDALADFLTNHTNYSTAAAGTPAWEPTAAATTVPYRFTWRLKGAANAAMNTSATEINFIWEAQSIATP